MGVPSLARRAVAAPEARNPGARTRYRDLDGVVRLVKRNGRSAAAAERALKEAFTERQAPAKSAVITADTRIEKVAALWFAEVEAMVDAGERRPRHARYLPLHLQRPPSRRSWWTGAGAVPHRSAGRDATRYPPLQRRRRSQRPHRPGDRDHNR